MTDRDGSEFDAIAAEYDRARPDYPDALVDAACARARLGVGSRALEIGCGTGQLTAALVARGLRVDAVDPGPHLIATARRRPGLDGVAFHLGRFEDVDLPAGTFDVIFSATAFHWVDPAVGWRKVAGLLRPGAVFALLQSGLLGLEPDEVEAWGTVMPEARDWAARDPYTLWDGVARRVGNVSELWSWLLNHSLAASEAAEAFRDVQILTSPRAHAESLDEYLGLVRTTSSYLRLGSDEQATFDAAVARMFVRTGGTRRWAGAAVLVTAIRAESAAASLG